MSQRGMQARPRPHKKRHEVNHVLSTVVRIWPRQAAPHQAESHGQRRCWRTTRLFWTEVWGCETNVLGPTMQGPPRHAENKAIKNLKKWPQQDPVWHNCDSTSIVKWPKSCKEMLFDQKVTQLREYFLEASGYDLAYFNAFPNSVDLQLILLFICNLIISKKWLFSGWWTSQS